jgi:ABC-type oligopeptide transport system ATPase subunit
MSAVKVDNLVKHFPIRGTAGVVQAVNDVSFEIEAGTLFLLCSQARKDG